jgi:outer membrane protein OmpA-like peptidoglycan-associated protein
LALGGTAENDLTDFTVGNTWTLVSAPLSITQSGHTDLRAQVYETTTGTTYYFDGGTLVSSGDQASSTGVVVTTTTTTTLPGATTTSVPGTTTATVAVEGNLKTAGVTVLFVSGESTLKSAAKSTLATLSKKLTSGASIIFTGYAKNNTALAKGRAEAVRNYLSSKVKIRFVLRMVTSSPANKVTVITTKN